MSRDWLKTLWKASYKGSSFWVERDGENGGRRIVIHQFPMRDDPFLEDLGEDKRDFEVTAYLASDSVDGDAGQLVQTCATRGPGLLVLPTHGGIMVRCISFNRSRSKDQNGYIAFSLKFVREGAASALISSALLANLVFVAADTMAVAAAASFASNLQVAGQPDYVVAAAVDGLQDAASMLEAVRTTEAVDPAVSSVQRDRIQAVFDNAATLTTEALPVTMYGTPAVAGTMAADLAAQVVAVARALGDAMPPDTGVQAFAQVAQEAASVDAAVAYPTPRRRIAALNDAEGRRLLRLAALAAYCEAVARVKLTDRPAGITLRANVVEFFEAEVDDLPAGEIDLYHAIEAMRDATVTYLSRSILDLAPVITVSANLSMPSLYWAWRLYQDPARSAEIVARNRIVHPSFMPPSFEALAK